MWSISAIKEKARERKETNRWKMILAGFILSLVLGTNVSANLSFTWMTDENPAPSHQETVYTDTWTTDEMNAQNPDIVYKNDQNSFWGDGLFVLIFLGFVLVLAMVLVMVVLIPLNVFLLNPISVGGRRFFYRNIREDAQAKELCYTFDHGYKNCVKVLFFRDLYLFFWTLLLIVPGIIKSYEYRMIPFLLAEHPQMSREQVFAESRNMMSGNKWKAFVFDLSFIGWRILSILTLGIFGIFYVDPYYHQADAMMYDAIKFEKGQEQWHTIS